MSLVRRGLERPDTITASNISARLQISQVIAEKIQEIESADDLKTVAEDVLPQIEKFLESPEERRLRRVRAGVVVAAIGLGGALVLFMISLKEHDMMPFISLGVVAFLIGIGLIINGLAFTVPRREIGERSDESRSQKELQGPSATNQLSPFTPSTNDLSVTSDRMVSQPSVTEHTTHHLNPHKS
jgi:hypothetical protein